MKKNEIKLTTNHGGKMSGIVSLSTAIELNTHCARHRNICGSVCQQCYAGHMANYYGWEKNGNSKFKTNYKILTTRLLTPEEIDNLKINSIFFRFEAFADIENELHAINYINICRAYPLTHFAIWTKNPTILNKAIEICGKPDNLKCIVSSLLFNIPSRYKADWVDHVFTVYTLEYIKEHPDTVINCGAKSCFTCHMCYINEPNQPYYIGEILKRDSNAYYKWLNKKGGEK